jgi:cytochrome c556
MKFKVFGAAVAALAMFAGLPALQAAEDKDVIDYRQNLMKSLGAHSGALGAILQNKVAYGDNLAHHADAIAAAAAAAQLAFKDEVVGGTSSAAVWEDWDDFSARFAQLEKAAMEVSAAAKEGGMAAAGPKVGAMFICKDCHDNYRTK